MDNAGAFTLGDLSLTAAGTINGDPLADLDGMRGFTVQASLEAGDGTSDDATAAIFIKTSIDQGQKWADVGVIRFNKNGGTQYLTVDVASTPVPIVGTTNALHDDSNSAIVAGIMGDRLMASVVTEGTFAGQTVCAIRVCVR